MLTSAFIRREIDAINEKWREIQKGSEFRLGSLAGRSSRHRPSRGEEFLFLLPSYQLVSVWSSRSRAPVFNRVGVGLVMSQTEVKEKCTAIRSYMSGLFETWPGSLMTKFTLTSLGIAIGHANIKRLIGEFANLSIWIN